MERRPITSRSNALIQGAALELARLGVTANQVSVFSMAACLLVPLGLFVFSGWAAAVLALTGVQLRLLANVLDGLIAVEGGKRSPVGVLYNEFPDRIADTIVLLSMGYAAGVPTLGWLATLLAALTAYVRVFGGALGFTQDFRGPMAKQHRMAVVSGALLAEGLVGASLGPGMMLQLALVVVLVGSAWTCVARTLALVQRLEAATKA